ncbi:MAG: CHAT domain-containing protein [Cyanobacteria bacterium P01_D01_bin.116]
MKKILILAANPTDTKQLRLDEEVREIDAGLKRAKNREEFEIISKWAVRAEDLRRALLDYEPQIVHFSGHGSGTEGLALENNSGQMQLVSSQALAGLFEQFSQVECVVLNACYSEVQAEAIHQHIDCVIGMNVAIGDKAAIKFAVGFYDALGAGRDYQESFKLGCNAIDLQGIPEYQTPQIKIRNNSEGTKVQTKSKELSLAQRLKKESLEKRLAVIEKDYQNLERQYRETGDADEKNRLQSKLNKKLEELEEIEKELNQINYGD